MNSELLEIMYDEEPEEGFVIKDDNQAEWALKKIAAARSDRDRLLSLIEDEENILALKKQKVNEQCEKDTAYFEGLLMKYFNMIEPKRTKTQATYKLLSGKLVRKFGTCKATYKDSELIQYFEDTDQQKYIKTEKKPDWAGFKKSLTITPSGVVTEDGELIDCITVEQQPDTFKVEVD